MRSKLLTVTGVLSILVICMGAAFGTFANAASDVTSDTTQYVKDPKNSRQCAHIAMHSDLKCPPVQSTHSMDISKLEKKIHNLEKRVAFLEK